MKQQIKKLNISDVIKSLNEQISKEDKIVNNLALDKLFKHRLDYCDEQKLTKHKYMVSALKDFRNSL